MAPGTKAWLRFDPPPPILSFPLMGGSDTFCGFLPSPYGSPPPLRGRIKVGGVIPELNHSVPDALKPSGPIGCCRWNLRPSIRRNRNCRHRALSVSVGRFLGVLAFLPTPPILTFPLVGGKGSAYTLLPRDIRMAPCLAPSVTAAPVGTQATRTPDASRLLSIARG